MMTQILKTFRSLFIVATFLINGGLGIIGGSSVFEQ